MSAPAQIYVSYLQQEGYRPNIDHDGDVIFKEEGRTYFIDIDTKDPMYFRLVFPNFWSINGGEELARVIFAANYATLRTKVAKVYVHEDGRNVSAAIEIFLSKPEMFKDVFPRAMSALKASVNNFTEKFA